MSENVRTLEDVLREHRFHKGRALCDCGIELGGTGHRTEAHRAHVAAEVRAWLAEVLAGASLRRNLAASIAYADAPPLRRHEGARIINPRIDLATAALTTVREHLTNTGRVGSEEGR